MNNQLIDFAFRGGGECYSDWGERSSGRGPGIPFWQTEVSIFVLGCDKFLQAWFSSNSINSCQAFSFFFSSFSFFSPLYSANLIPLKRWPYLCSANLQITKSVFGSNYSLSFNYKFSLFPICSPSLLARTLYPELKEQLKELRKHLVESTNEMAPLKVWQMQGGSPSKSLSLSF